MNDHNTDTIFVAIPALNEYFTMITVQDAYKKAKNPSKVFFGIFNQKTNGYKFENFSEYPNVRCVNVSYEDPLGLGLARLACSTLHNDEEYFLQLDAHTIFCKDWDSILIENFKQLKTYCEKPLISQSISWHGEEVYFDPEKKYINNFIGDKAYPLSAQEDGLSTSPDQTREEEEKILGKFLEHYLCFGGGGLFGESKFLYNISYNPFIPFAPEQELTALRASTRGYRFFSTEKTVISTMGKHEETGFTKQKYPDDRLYTFNGALEGKKVYGNWGYEYLYGKKFGFWGAENQEAYDEYVKKSNNNFEENDKKYHNRKEI
jgi:hypothetical protein